MTFIAVLRAGKGCDYTIGCGLQVEEFEGPDIASAQAWVEELLDSYDRDEESPLRALVIYEVASTGTVDLRAARDRRAQAIEDERNRASEEAYASAAPAREAAERAEYERLAAKYGGGT